MEITNEIAAEILQSKILECEKKMETSAPFLLDDLIAEKQSYKRQLKRLKGGESG